jgi:hypothetical protein
VNELSEVASFMGPRLPRLPETGLIGAVQNLGVHQEFTIPSDIDLLRDFNP